MSADGISLQDSLVDLHLGEATVWQTLRFLLEPLLLDWHGADGVLSITTHIRADEIHVTRIYDVQAIFTAIEPQLKNMPPRLRSNIGGGSGAFCGGGHSGGGGGLFRVPDPAEPATAPTFVLAQFGGGYVHPGWHGLAGRAGSGIPIRSQSMKTEELLVDLLMHNVVGRPLSDGRSKWEAIDGEGGTVNVGRGRLIVRQQYQVQFLIREMLQAVEEFIVRGTKVKSILIARPGYPHEEDAAIFKRLAEPQDIEAKAAPLDKTLAQLAKEGRYRLWIDKESLADDGIDLKQQVTLKLSGTTLDTVLHKLLDPLLLTFVVEEGTLVITTAVKADEMMSTRVCLTGDIPEARSVSDLLTAIQEETSGKWEDIDGDGGTLWMVVPEWLVVRQTQACHRETAELLDDLRQAAVAPIEAAAPEIELRLYPVADATAPQDLIDSLPKLIPTWDAKQGSIVALGQSLAIKQPVLVHERLDEIFSALNQAHARLNPPQPKVEPKPAPAAK